MDKEVRNILAIKSLAHKAYRAARRMNEMFPNGSDPDTESITDLEKYMKQSTKILDSVEELNAAIVEWQKVNK